MEAVIKNSESMQPEDIGHVSYKQTRVVQLSPSTLERNRIVSFDKADPASRAFDMLRTRVMQKMDERGWRTLAITSPGPEAGKTLVAVNLAMSIAHQTQKTVMLVDFDLRKPKVASYLGLPFGTSLNDVLEGKGELSDALVNPGLPRLVILPTAQPVIHASEALLSKRVANIVIDLRERYESRIVAFDLPPLLNTDDAIAVLPQMDCVLLVVGEGMSQSAEIEECMRLIPQDKLLGVVLNKAEEVQQRAYY
jgi:Mrp family chromosome partitioning ATPase